MAGKAKGKVAAEVKPVKKMGKPTSYTPEKFAEIEDRLSKGEPLAQICRDAHMPHPTTVYDWVEAHGLSQRFARARANGFDAIALDALRIADTPVEGVKVKITEDGEEITKEDMLGHRKLQVETRLKLLAKWDPKRYGEKLALGGADDLPAIKMQDEKALDARLAELLAKANAGTDAS